MYFNGSFCRLEMSFTKIEIEQWGKSEIESSRNGPAVEYVLPNAHEDFSIFQTPSCSTDVIDLLNDIYLSVESGTIIEISDSDDDVVDIQYENSGANGTQNGNEKDSSVSNHNDDDYDKSISTTRRTVQVPMTIEVVEVEIPLDRCDSNQRNGKHVMRSDSRNDGASNDLDDAEADSTANVPIKTEFNASHKSESVDEVDNIPLFKFDPRMGNNRSSTKN